MSDTAKNVLDSFEKWVLVPLRRVLIGNPKETHFIAFVILCVAIDNLASIRYLGDYPPKRQRYHGKKRYKDFIENYMPKPYQAFSNTLYEDFRCNLVHQFQLTVFDVQQSPSSEKMHLQRIRNGKICLNSRLLYEDIRSAYKKLRKELIGKHPDKQALTSFSNAGYQKWSHKDV